MPVFFIRAQGLHSSGGFAILKEINYFCLLELVWLNMNARYSRELSLFEIDAARFRDFISLYFKPV